MKLHHVSELNNALPLCVPRDHSELERLANFIYDVLYVPQGPARSDLLFTGLVTSADEALEFAGLPLHHREGAKFCQVLQGPELSDVPVRRVASIHAQFVNQSWSVTKVGTGVQFPAEPTPSGLMLTMVQREWVLAAFRVRRLAHEQAASPGPSTVLPSAGVKCTRSTASTTAN